MNSIFFKISEEEKLTRDQLMCVLGGNNGIDGNDDHEGPKTVKPVRPTDPTPPLPTLPLPTGGGK